MPEVQKVAAMAGVQTVVADQCMYGLCDPSGLHYKKPTRIIGNVLSLERLHKVCDRSHEHQEVIGTVRHEGRFVSRSMLAGAYPQALSIALANLAYDSLCSCQQARRRRLAASLGHTHGP